MYTPERGKKVPDFDNHGRRSQSRASNQSNQSKASRGEQRINDREMSHQKRIAQADKLKEEGNSSFREGRYVEAIAKYNEATKIVGLRPIIMSNLAAAYLKLEQYELAEWACDCVLLYSPNMAKARFRRALARKGQGMNEGAELDLLVVIENHPEIKEAQEELIRVRLERNISGDGQRAESAYDENFPPVNTKEWDPPLDSDSEDSKLTGNRRPCKFHNHGGCKRGLGCNFSHAPDESSVRDSKGQNVCLNFLLDRCEYPNCSYSHDKYYLGQGWWSSTAEVKAAIKLRDSIADPTTDAATITFLENTCLYGRYKKAREYLLDFDSISNLTPDVLKSKLKEKVHQPTGNSSEISPQDGSFVLLLCLGNEALLDSNHGHLLDVLRTKFTVIRARNATQALTYLEAPELVGTVVTDAEIMDSKYSNIVHKLVDYVEAGGSAVFACSFPRFVSRANFDRFFSQYFALDWKYGSRFRTNYSKNPDSELVKKTPSLDQSYSMEAQNIQVIPESSALYKANVTLSTSTPNNDFVESPAVAAPVGSGYVSFLGDLNAEKNSANLLVAMLGLPDPALPPPFSLSSQQKPEQAQIPTQESGSNRAAGTKSGRNTPNSFVSSQPSGSSLPPLPKSSITTLPSEPSVSPSTTLAASPLPPSSPNIRTRGVFRNAKTPKSTRDGHFIMQLTLEYGYLVDNMCKSQLDAIRVKADVKKAATEAQAIKLLASPHLCGVFATDPGLTNPRYSRLLKRLVGYVSEGGCLVFGGAFASLVQYPDIARLFASFDLRWKAGVYTRDSLERNLNDNDLVEAYIFLPERICIQAIFLCGVEVEKMLYTPVSGSKITQAQSPIVFSDVGKGRVGFIGDMNAENWTTPSLLAMFGLLQLSGSAPKPHPHNFIIVLTHSDTIREYEQTSLFLKLKEKHVEIITGEHLSDPRLADLLSSRDILGVLVLDDMFSPPDHEWLGHQVAAYVWSGGTAIFGGDFGIVTPPDVFERFISENFCLPWKISSATELSVKLNEDNALIRSSSISAPQQSVDSEGAFIYDVKSEAMVCRSEPDLGPERTTHVSVAYTEVGKGYVAYFGHEEIRELDTTLILAMMKL